MQSCCTTQNLPSSIPLYLVSTLRPVFFPTLSSSRIEFPEFASFMLPSHFILQRIFQVSKLSFDLITSIIIIIELLGCRGVTPPTITGIPDSSFSHCFPNLGQMATGSDDRGRGFSPCQSPLAESYIRRCQPPVSFYARHDRIKSISE